MMLGSKGLFPPTDAYELLRCKAAHAILVSRSYYSIATNLCKKIFSQKPPKALISQEKEPRLSELLSSLFDDFA